MVFNDKKKKQIWHWKNSNWIFSDIFYLFFPGCRWKRRGCGWTCGWVHGGWNLWENQRGIQFHPATVPLVSHAFLLWLHPRYLYTFSFSCIKSLSRSISPRYYRSPNSSTYWRRCFLPLIPLCRSFRVFLFHFCLFRLRSPLPFTFYIHTYNIPVFSSACWCVSRISNVRIPRGLEVRKCVEIIL